MRVVPGSRALWGLKDHVRIHTHTRILQSMVSGILLILESVGSMCLLELRSIILVSPKGMDPA